MIRQIGDRTEIKGTRFEILCEFSTLANTLYK